jgi:hypothetical protein
MAHANPASTNVFLGRGATPVVFRSKTSSNTGSITPPTGAAVGDIVVVVMSAVQHRRDYADQRRRRLEQLRTS